MTSEKALYRDKYRPLLNQCGQMAASHLQKLLIDMFASSENILLDQAHNTSDEESKNNYLLAKETMSRYQVSIEQTFKAQFVKGFDKFWNDTSEQTDATNISLESGFTLITDETMEETVAVSNIARRANESMKEELYGIQQRLSAINGGEPVSHDEIPAGPEHLTHAFSRSLAKLDIPIEQRKIILNLFGRQIVQQLAPMYDKYNEILRNGGVLPNLAHEIYNRGGNRPGKEENRGTGGGSGGSAGAGGSSASGQSGGSPATSQIPEGLNLAATFDSIFNLMGRIRQGATGQMATGQIATGQMVTEQMPTEQTTTEYMPDIFQSAAQGFQQTLYQPLSSNEIVTVLNRIQNNEDKNDTGAILTEDFFSLPDLELNDELLTRIDQTMKEERSRTYRLLPLERVKVADAISIELLGKLFQYMLQEPLLPSVVKTLLSNLHVPYLKIAILDHSLFTEPQHVARRLFDLLVEAGGIWVNKDDLSHGIYPDMQHTVERIQKEFSDDMGLFDQLLTFLTERVNDFREGSEAIEIRTRNTARGRERVEIARRQAVREIGARINHPSLPAVVREFLGGVWTDRLIFILLQSSSKDNNEEWKEALKLMDKLVSLFDPKQQSPVSEQALQELSHSLQQGVNSLGDQLQGKYHDLFQLLATPEMITEAVMSMDEVSFEMVSNEEHTIPSSLIPPHPPSDEEQKTIDQLRETAVGTWFELVDNDGYSTKAKLSWISPITSNCIFVDGSGQLTLTKPLHILAKDVLLKNARPIDVVNEPFFTRTLLRIEHQLQHTSE